MLFRIADVIASNRFQIIDTKTAVKTARTIRCEPASKAAQDANLKTCRCHGASIIICSSRRWNWPGGLVVRSADWLPGAKGSSDFRFRRRSNRAMVWPIFSR